MDPDQVIKQAVPEHLCWPVEWIDSSDSADALSISIDL
jgi:hypothetical protein